MNKPITSLILISFLITTFTMITRQQHLLSTLLCLEALLLYMICYLPITLNNNMMNMSSLMIILLILGVCSASIGLALLVMASRNEGSDSTLSSVISTC